MTHIIQSADTYKTVKAEFVIFKTVKAEYDTHETVKAEYDIYKTAGLGVQSRVQTGCTPTQHLLLRFAGGLERVDCTGCEPHGRVKRLSCSPLSSECGTYETITARLWP